MYLEKENWELVSKINNITIVEEFMKRGGE